MNGSKRLSVLSLFALSIVAPWGQAAAQPDYSRIISDPSVAASSRSAIDTPQTQRQRMVAAFNAWTTRWNVSNAALAIMQGDGLIGSSFKGGHRPTRPQPVASLSKAITGVCITKLVDDRQLTFKTPLRSLLAAYLAAHPPADGRVRNITVGQLLTHSSGITNDITQGRFPPGLNFSRTNMQEQARASLSAALGSAPGSSYFYNNINYLLLGMIIEAKSGGETYEAYCKRRTMTSLGIKSAKLNPKWRIMGAYGGWLISARDYAKFLAHLDPDSRLLRSPLRKWPRWNFSGGSSYSIGVAFRPSASYYNFWHAGAWTWNGLPYPASFSAYFVSMRNELRYVVTDAPRVSTDARNDLDRVMWQAAYPPT